MVGQTLSNKAGITLTGTWVLPPVEWVFDFPPIYEKCPSSPEECEKNGAVMVSTPGTIQNTVMGENGYLSVNDNTDAGSVVVEEALDSSDVGQIWERSANDASGFFTLKNPNSGLFLTMKTANTLTIGKV